MKCYVQHTDGGFPRKYENFEADATEFLGVFIDKWNDLVRLFERGELEKDKLYSDFGEYYKNFLWKFHEVQYDFHIELSFKSLRGDVGKCVEVKETKYKDMEKQVLLEAYKRWHYSGFHRKEFFIYAMDLTVEIVSELYIGA